MDFEVFRDQLQARIGAGNLPPTFSLKALFGGEWPVLPDGVRPNELGTWFKEHVRGSISFTGESPFEGIEFSHTTSNNLTYYRVAA